MKKSPFFYIGEIMGGKRGVEKILWMEKAGKMVLFVSKRMKIDEKISGFAEKFFF